MKKTLIILFVLLWNSSFSQVKIIHPGLAYPDSAILFKDIKNHLIIEGLKFEYGNEIMAEGASFSMIGKNRLLVSYIKADSVKIKISRLSRNKQNLIYSKTFGVQTAGSPEVHLQEENNDTMSNGQILNRSRLIVQLPNPNYAGDFKVAHFEISIKDLAQNEVLKPTFISGNQLGKEIMDKITSLEKGSSILLSNIILTYTDGGYFKHKDVKLLKN